MPTRLDVLLQRRKSALAEPLHRHSATTARAAGRRRPKDRGFRNGRWSRIIARSYIISLKISRNPAVTVNGRGDIQAAFSCKGIQIAAVASPCLRYDMAKLMTSPR